MLGSVEQVEIGADRGREEWCKRKSEEAPVLRAEELGAREGSPREEHQGAVCNRTDQIIRT